MVLPFVHSQAVAAWNPTTGLLQDLVFCKEFIIWALFMFIWLASGYIMTWPPGNEWTIFTIALWAFYVGVSAVQATVTGTSATLATTSSLTTSMGTVTNTMTTLMNRHTQYQAINNQVNKRFREELNKYHKILNKKGVSHDIPQDVRDFMETQIRINANLTARLDDAENELRTLRLASSSSKKTDTQLEDQVV